MPEKNNNEKINKPFFLEKIRFRQKLFLKSAPARDVDEKNKNITQTNINLKSKTKIMLG